MSQTDVHGTRGTEAPTAALWTKGLTKIYGSGENEVRALDGVDLAIAGKRFTVIMGPSGSGKSTLLYCISGLDTVTTGQVTLGHTDITKLDDRGLTLLRRDKFGFIFQGYNLIPTLTAAENIELPLKLADRDIDREWLARVVEALSLGDRLDHKPSQLSSGQQQRVAAARSLAGRPDIVFADEPTGALDSKSSDELLDFMRRVVDELGQTLVMVTHNPFASARADRVLFLADGRFVGEMAEPDADRVIEQMRSLGE